MVPLLRCGRTNGVSHAFADCSPPLSPAASCDLRDSPRHWVRRGFPLRWGTTSDQVVPAFQRRLPRPVHLPERLSGRIAPSAAAHGLRNALPTGVHQHLYLSGDQPAARRALSLRRDVLYERTAHRSLRSGRRCRHQAAPPARSRGCPRPRARHCPPQFRTRPDRPEQGQ